MTAPADTAELDIEFPPKPEYIRTIRHAVAALARLHEVPDELVEEIKLAVSEACTSALPDDSAKGKGTPSPVRVLAETGPGTVTVEVIDRGSALARAVSGKPSELSTGDMPFERRLALPLIRGLVDELSITPLEGGGAAVRMVVSVEDRQT